jgi:hypothetical protein
MQRSRQLLAAVSAIVAILAASGCQADSPRSVISDTLTPAARQLADSAVGDSAAFAALPPTLAAALDVRRVFDPAFLGDSARAYCQPLGAADAPHQRRRIRVRLGDTLVVLFARADRATASLQRVELVRRPLDGGLQHGFTWDVATDEAREVDWVADVATATESGQIPRSSPAPRAIRAIGRLVLAAPCTGVRRP